MWDSGCVAHVDGVYAGRFNRSRKDSMGERAEGKKLGLFINLTVWSFFLDLRKVMRCDVAGFR